MKGIFQRLCGVLGAGALVVSLPLLIDLGFRWQMAKEEQTLEELKIDQLEIKGATLDEALREITFKVHSLGHPEVDFIVWREGAWIPGFHRLLASVPHFDPPEKIELSVIPNPQNAGEADVAVPGFSSLERPATLGKVLWMLTNHYERPCVLRGHRIEAARVAGSLKPFYHVEIEIPQGVAGRYYSPDGFKALLNENAVQYYEGMSVKYVWGSQGPDKLDVYAPQQTIEFIQFLFDANRGMPWERFQWRVKSWYEDLRSKFL